MAQVNGIREQLPQFSPRRYIMNSDDEQEMQMLESTNNNESNSLNTEANTTKTDAQWDLKRQPSKDEPEGKPDLVIRFARH